MGMRSFLVAGVIFTFLYGSVSYAEINYTFAEGDAFDNVQIGATMTRTNAAVLSDFVTMSSWDIVASTNDADLASMKSARNTGAKHKTNFRINGLGINNAFISGDESSQFKKAEAWIIQFDKDVFLKAIDFHAMTGGNNPDTMELYVDGIKKLTFDGNDAQSDGAGMGGDGIYEFDPIPVPAGAKVEFSCVNGGSICIQTISIKTSAEWKTLGLIM